MGALGCYMGLTLVLYKYCNSVPQEPFIMIVPWNSLLLFEMKGKEPTIESLLAQKRNLLVQYEEQKLQIERIEEEVVVFEQKKGEYQQFLACVHRLWSGLLEDISTLCKDTPTKGKEEEDASVESSLESLNPYLARLLSLQIPGQDVNEQDLEQLQGSDEQDVIFIQTRLKKLVQKTLDYLSRVVDYIRDYDRKRMNMKVKGYMTESQREELRQETDEMTKKVEKLQQLYKSSKQYAEELRGRCTDSFRRIREVNNDLENAKQELLGAKRKLWKHEQKTGYRPGSAEKNIKIGGLSEEDGDDEHEGDIQKLGKQIQDKLDEKLQEIVQQQQQIYDTEKQIDEINIQMDKEYKINDRQELKDIIEKVYQLQNQQKLVAEKIVELQSESTAVRYQEHGHRLRVEEAEILKIEVEHMVNICRGYEDDVRELRGRVWEMQGELRALRDAQLDDRSVQHWKKMHSNLEQQNKQNMDKLRRMQDRKERVKEAELQWLRMECEAEKERLQNQRIRSIISDHNQKLGDLKSKKRKFENRIRELETFTSVTVLLGGVDSSHVEKSKKEASEQLQLKQLQQQDDVDYFDKRKNEIDYIENQISRDVENLKSEVNGLSNETEKLNKEIGNLMNQIQESQIECECFLNELEVTVKGYEGTIGENQEICKSIEKKDEEINLLKSERDKLHFERIDLEIQFQKISQSQHKAEDEKVQISNQCLNLQTAIQAQQEEFQNCQQKTRKLDDELQEIKRDCKHTEENVKEKDEEIRKLKEEQQYLDEQIQQQELIFKNERILEAQVLSENNVLRRSLGNNASLLVSGRSASELFKQLRCSVCNVREKDTLITRCFHTFCRECLNKLGDARQRRCPRCNVPFLTSELRSFELD